MKILAVTEEEDTTALARAVWEDIAKSVNLLGLTEEVCSCALMGIQNYGNRRAYEASQNSAQATLALALDDCRATLEGLLGRLNRTGEKINQGRAGRKLP